MTTNTQEGNVPVFTIADRLRKAREVAGLGQRELADAIGVSRGTVSNYEGGIFPPKRPVLLSWAMATGVPLRWLETGEVPGPDGNGKVTGSPTLTYVNFLEMVA